MSIRGRQGTGLLRRKVMDKGSPQLTPGVRKRVFISYSRLEPDERVAKQLYEALRGSHDIFYDCLIEPGEVWSQRIEQELNAAHYFVVLLSEKSIAQEGLQGEIEIACEMNKQNAGKPVVIPVRVRYDKRLPYDLFMRLRRIQHFNWSDDADTRLIADRLRTTMQAGVAPGTSVDQAPAAAPEKAQPADADLDMCSPDSNIFSVEQVTPLEVKGESDDERKEKQIAAFYDEAQVAMAAQDWALAIEKLQAILSLDPAHVEVEEKLREAQQQQELGTLYNLGRKLFEEGSWGKALDAFHELQERAGDYEDISALITTAEGELARKQVVTAPTAQPEEALKAQESEEELRQSQIVSELARQQTVVEQPAPLVEAPATLLSVPSRVNHVLWAIFVALGVLLGVLLVKQPERLAPDIKPLPPQEPVAVTPKQEALPETREVQKSPTKTVERAAPTVRPPPSRMPVAAAVQQEALMLELKARLEQEQELKRRASRDRYLDAAQKALRQKQDQLAKDAPVMSENERRKLEREIQKLEGEISTVKQKKTTLRDLLEVEVPDPILKSLGP